MQRCQSEVRNTIHWHLPLQVKLGEGEYIFTEEGDQLGYLNLEYTGSIGYTFLLNPFEQGPWSTRYGGSLPQPWDRITFDQSWLPYDFAIGARYDTGTVENFLSGRTHLGSCLSF
jgi:hypothetical protein